ncbi:MAG: chorismate synthase [Candidatus Melainabacteria bacterium]|nr:chorismate synthase [Candidatus Melainabacteria bacterium]
MRFLTTGESHGPALVAVLEGMPAGLKLNIDQINEDMWRRQQGYGRGNRQKIEKDKAEIIGGVRHGITTGAPIAMMIRNRDFENWQHVMSVEPVDMSLPEVIEQFEKKVIERFRPGHADLAGTLKYRQTDIRDVLERASARETASRVAAGGVCRQLLEAFGIKAASHVIQVGSVKANSKSTTMSIDEIDAKVVQSELFCLDDQATEEMKELIKATWTEGDSLGGVVEVVVDGLPVGLGSYTQWDKRLDGQLAQAVMSIQAMKAVEIGDGVEASGQFGSLVHDPIYPADSKARYPFTRKTNHAGGLEGGMTNGERLCVRVYMKPIPTLRKGLDSLSFPEFEAQKAHYERSDVCAIAAASVVCRAMVCLVLANAMVDKFGGDSIADLKSSFLEYEKFCRKDEGKNGKHEHAAIESPSMDAEPEGNESALGEF